MRRGRLDNGLRFVVIPRPGCRVVSVSVAYRAGFRDEQPGQAGFAHLFEHLMTQGSPRLAKLEHKTRVEAAGGWYSGSTRADCTPYVATLPAGGLEMALACEADRMAGVILTQENLDNQVSVVEQEIRGNILSVPYGGYPCFPVDAALFARFENSHDGYGPFEDLRQASLSDAADFHDRYYRASNAVVAVAGDVEAEQCEALIRSWFDPLPSRPAPPPRDVDEPAPSSEVQVRLADPLATMSVLALGFRVPSPDADWRGYVGARLLCDVMTRRLGNHPQLGRAVAALGSLGDWTASAGPTQLALGVGPFPAGEADAARQRVDEELRRTVVELDDHEVRLAATQLASAYRRSQDQVYVAAQTAATLELLHDAPERALTVPDELVDLTAKELVALLDEHVVTTRRAVVEIGPA